MNKLGEKLKYLRTVHRLTLDELSKMTGISSLYLSHIEQGVVIPYDHTIREFASIYGVNLDEYLKENLESKDK